MNLPNKLTFSRIILAPIFMVFFLIDNIYSKLLALFIFMLAALTDLYDGYLARRTGVITGFGKFMDPLADKILTSTAFISFVALGYAKAWIVLIIVVREFLITGIRSLAAYRGVVIMPSILAQWKTALQMSAVVIILLFINLKTFLIPLGHNWKVFHSAWTYRFFDYLLFVVMLITVASGVDYLVKNGFLLKGVLK